MLRSERSFWARLWVIVVVAIVASSCGASRTGQHADRVAGFSLVSTGVQLRNGCAGASRHVGFRVPCPAVLPKAMLGDPAGCSSVLQLPPCVFPTAYPVKRGWYGFVLNWTGFVVPPGYAGVPGPYPSGHLVIEAERVGQQASFGCSDGKIRGAVRERGLRITWVNCPTYSSAEEIGGHLVARWDMGGIAYLASLHGWSLVNRTLLVAIVRSIQFVGP